MLGIVIISSYLTAGIIYVIQIRKLDDTEFKNPWARAYIRVTIKSSILFVELVES